MTFISFPDVMAISKGGNYRLEIRGSADKNDFFRDQSQFVYRLSMTATGHEIWEWSPLDQDGIADYPREAWVDDDGWVVVRLHTWFHAGLLVISPDGKRRTNYYLQSFKDGELGLLEGEPDIHIGNTSAGPTWEESSIALFHRFGHRPFWSILTWWGRRILIDLEEGVAVDKLPDEQVSLIADLERSWILDQLQRTQCEIQSHNESRRTWWKQIGAPTYSAAFHAGLWNVQEAVPLLRGLETNEVSGYSTSRSWVGLVFLPFRSIAKISLLRLCVEPQWLASFLLTEQSTGQRCNYPERREPQALEIIGEGMSQRAVLQQVGVPEFLEDKWDYCILDHGRALTIRVHWHDKHKRNRMDWQDRQKMIEEIDRYREAINREPPIVERVEFMQCPPWLASPTREYAIAHHC